MLKKFKITMMEILNTHCMEKVVFVLKIRILVIRYCLEFSPDTSGSCLGFPNTYRTQRNYVHRSGKNLG